MLCNQNPFSPDVKYDTVHHSMNRFFHTNTSIGDFLFLMKKRVLYSCLGRIQPFSQGIYHTGMVDLRQQNRYVSQTTQQNKTVSLDPPI